MAGSAGKEVSVLIPVYSEVDSLAETVRLSLTELGSRTCEILLLVHEKSRPECWELCHRLAAEHPEVQVHRQLRYPGQGYAYRQGIEMARGHLLLFLNSDLETEPRHIGRLLEKMDQGDYDLVVASRWAKGSAFDRTSYGNLKWFLNFAVQHIFALLTMSPLSEFTFAYKLARTSLFQSVTWQGTGHEFAFESTLKPVLLGAKVGQVPTSWVGRREGVSHQPFWRNLRHIGMGLRLVAEKWCRPVWFGRTYLQPGFSRRTAHQHT